MSTKKTAKKKLPLCFSCDKNEQKYITGLCEECHQVAMKSDEEWDAKEDK